MSNGVRSQLSNQNTKIGMNKQGIDLLVLFSVLKKRFVFIALLTLLAVIVSGLFSYFIVTPVYVARTVLRVTQVAQMPQEADSRNDANSFLNSISRIPVLTMNTYLGQIKSEALMQRVIDKLNLNRSGYTPRTLAAQIQATAAQDSYLIEVSVYNSDPILAEEIANTLTREYIALISENNREAMDRSVKFLREEMEHAKLELAATSDPYERQRLQGVLNLLVEGITRTQISRSIDLGNASLVIVSPAIAPNSPAKPDIGRNMAVAFMLGLAASVTLVIVREFYSNKIKTPEDIAQYLDLPVLGVIAHADRRALS